MKTDRMIAVVRSQLQVAELENDTESMQRMMGLLLMLQKDRIGEQDKEIASLKRLLNRGTYGKTDNRAA